LPMVLLPPKTRSLNSILRIIKLINRLHVQNFLSVLKNAIQWMALLKQS
jgi:hypothetical protein